MPVRTSPNKQPRHVKANDPAGIAALAMTRQWLPPTLNLDVPDDACDLDYIPHEGRAARVDGGPMFKRMRPRARGMAHVVARRSAHISVTVE